jgi:hypothetical protein
MHTTNTRVGWSLTDERRGVARDAEVTIIGALLRAEASAVTV